MLLLWQSTRYANAAKPLCKINNRYAVPKCYPPICNIQRQSLYRTLLPGLLPLCGNFAHGFLFCSRPHLNEDIRSLGGELAPHPDRFAILVEKEREWKAGQR
jgi:hypothetical protein